MTACTRTRPHIAKMSQQQVVTLYFKEQNKRKGVDLTWVTAGRRWLCTISPNAELTHEQTTAKNWSIHRGISAKSGFSFSCKLCRCFFSPVLHGAGGCLSHLQQLPRDHRGAPHPVDRVKEIMTTNEQQNFVMKGSVGSHASCFSCIPNHCDMKITCHCQKCKQIRRHFWMLKRF